MVTTPTKPVEQVPEYLAEFDDEVTTNNALPFAQVQNPPNTSLAKIERLKEPWGIFIASDQAELAQFTPTDNFNEITLVFGEDSEKPREVQGYITRHTRWVVIARSLIEVQDSDGYYLGLAFEKGKKTELGKKAWADSDNYRVRTRYLIVFLDEENQPLHKTPFRLSMGKGTGGAFSEELKLLCGKEGEMNRVYAKLIDSLIAQGKISSERKKKTLSEREQSLSVLDIDWTVTKNEGKAPFLTPCHRLAPAIESVGLTKEYERHGRKVVLEGVPIDSLLIPKSSSTGQFILSIWEEYQDFATKYQDENEGASQQRATEEHTEEDVPEPMDFTWIINRTNDLMKQLSWTPDDGRDYIIEKYGKKSRQLLNDEELIEFLRYLEDLALQQDTGEVEEDDLEF